MNALDADQRRGIATLLRAYAESQRKLSAAIALLSFCQRNEKYPKDFRAELESGENAPRLCQYRKGYDTVASHLEQSADDIDLTEVLSRLPRGSVN